MVDSNSNTLRDVMKADISLGNSGASNCWTRQMKDAFGDLQNGTVYRSDLFQCRKLNISNLRIDLRFRHQAVWREAHGQDPCSSLKKSVAYHNWFALPERPVSDARAPFVLPEYLKMRNISRFRLRAHTLKVEAAAWLKDGSRVCDHCPDEDEHVQNEVHTLLICQDHRVCELRKHFSFLFTPFLRTFQQPNPFCCNRSTPTCS